MTTRKSNDSSRGRWRECIGNTIIINIRYVHFRLLLLTVHDEQSGAVQKLLAANKAQI
jgi:hypothetical protein